MFEPRAFAGDSADRFMFHLCMACLRLVGHRIIRILWPVCFLALTPRKKLPGISYVLAATWTNQLTWILERITAFSPSHFNFSIPLSRAISSGEYQSDPKGNCRVEAVCFCTVSFTFLSVSETLKLPLWKVRTWSWSQPRHLTSTHDGQWMENQPDPHAALRLWLTDHKKNSIWVQHQKVVFFGRNQLGLM
jgi:hypothetical protein